MRIGIVLERKSDFLKSDPAIADVDSELLSEFEEDSLISGLRDAGHDVFRIGDVALLLRRHAHWRKQCDLALNLPVGKHGIERKLHAAALLEIARIPYLGSTAYVQMLTRNKHHAKLVAGNAGVMTPRSVLVDATCAELPGSLNFPAIVKPVAESSSIGIDSRNSIVHNPSEAFAQAQAVMTRYKQAALVEEFVAGAEIEVPLFVDPVPRALGAVGITIDGQLVDGEVFLSSDLVYGDGYGFGLPPAQVDIDRVKNSAVQAAAALGIRDFGRIDFRVDQAGTPWFIEASTQPHLMQHSSFFWLAKQRGRTYPDFLDELVNVAVNRLKSGS